MMNDPIDPLLQEPLEQLLLSCRAHAIAMSDPNADPARSVQVGLALQNAARHYADAAFELSGWGSPFAGISTADVDDEYEVSEPHDEHARSAGVLTLRIREDYEVDAHALIEDAAAASDFGRPPRTVGEAAYSLLDGRPPMLTAGVVRHISSFTAVALTPVPLLDARPGAEAGYVNRVLALEPERDSVEYTWFEN